MDARSRSARRGGTSKGAALPEEPAQRRAGEAFPRRAGACRREIVCAGRRGARALSRSPGSACRHTGMVLAGPMNFYLNYLAAEVALPGESAPIGIVLCAEKEAAEVQYATGGLDRQVFVSRYLVALPTEDQCRPPMSRSTSPRLQRAVATSGCRGPCTAS